VAYDRSGHWKAAGIGETGQSFRLRLQNADCMAIRQLGTSPAIRPTITTMNSARGASLHQAMPSFPCFPHHLVLWLGMTHDE
jgi:hypothetical protein